MTHPLSASLPLRPRRAALLLLAAAGCAEVPDRDAIRAMPAEASLDARGLGRGGADRPPAVASRRVPDRGVTLLTVSPRLRTGSASSPPMIVTSLGAERDDATGAARPSALVVISNARAYGGFSRAESRDGTPVTVRVLGRTTDCGMTSDCLFVETLLLTWPEADLRRATEAGTGLRLRIEGNAAFVEAGLPAGHLRALAAELARPAP